MNNDNKNFFQKLINKTLNKNQDCGRRNKS